MYAQSKIYFNKQYKRWICPTENLKFKVILQPSLSFVSVFFVMTKTGHGHPPPPPPQKNTKQPKTNAANTPVMCE